MLTNPDSEVNVESIWTEIKSCLINARDSACDWTERNDKQERETWWWDETVESLVQQKRKLWKEWHKGVSKEKYLDSKRRAKLGVYIAKRKAQEEKLLPAGKQYSKTFIFKLAKRMKRENQGLVGDKCVNDSMKKPK